MNPHDVLYYNCLIKIESYGPNDFGDKLKHILYCALWHLRNPNVQITALKAVGGLDISSVEFFFKGE